VELDDDVVRLHRVVWALLLTRLRACALARYVLMGMWVPDL
jgi:hypothetical protein